MTQDLSYTAEIVVYDPALPGTRTLYYATTGFSSKATDTPANTHFDERLVQPADMRRTAFALYTSQGRSQYGFGDLVLANGDGLLDGLLAYGFDGRAITIRRGTVGTAYPAAWTTTLVATMQQAEFDAQTVTIKLRDRQYQTTVPFQPTKFAGTNSLPSGLEGVATDLKGKPKPIALGKVTNVSPPCVNTSKLIYQLHDGALASVDAVYDRGIALGANPSLWDARSSGVGGGTAAKLNGAAYGAGVYVVVGESNAIYTSPDGVTWTSRTSALTAGATIYDVQFGGGQFVAVSFSAAEVQTSPDGITWTKRTTGLAGLTLTHALYSTRLSLWIIVGSDGKVRTSPDAITWTSRTTAFSGGGFYALWLAESETTVVMVGQNGQIATSTDAITWTIRTDHPFGTNDVGCVARANGLFVAGGGAIGSPIIATSSDGVAWSSQKTPPAALGPTAIVAGLGYIILSGGYTASVGQNTLASQDGGLTWQSVNTTEFSGGTARGFAVGPAGFLIVGHNGANGRVMQTHAPSAYAALADVSDDSLAPPAGSFKYYLGGGGNGAYIRLGSPPAGTITADVTQGATAADRTAAQLFKAVLVRAGFSAGDYSASDITALDGLTSAVLGYWTDQETTYAAVLDAIAQSVGAWWGVDAAGVFRIQQVVDPSGGSSVATYTANDILAEPKRVTVKDPGSGIPYYRTTVYHTRNYTVQTTDLAGGVSADRRAVLAEEFASVNSTDASVQTAHLLSIELPIRTLLTSASDASTEAARVQTLRGTKRDLFELVVPVDGLYPSPDLGNVVTFSPSRFSLSAGKKFLCLGVEPSARDRRATLTLWG
ncbi:MAG: hypothetical protein HY275_03565 [Gemmatimonadetes bacterium]|nr:hypothetical protein [Gemmatimonadota bacterium]